MEKIRQSIEIYIHNNGISMTKQISSGGFFADPVYDNRRVYSIKDMNKLNKIGFSVNEDMGIVLFNSIMLIEQIDKGE